MSDSDSGQKSSGMHGPFLKSTKYLLTVFILIYIIQLAVNPPYRRPYIACWLPYLIDESVTVKARQIFTPTEHQAIITQILRAGRFNLQCINWVSKLDFINKSLPWQQPPLTGEVETASKQELREDQKFINSTLDFSDMDEKFKISEAPLEGADK